MNIHNATLALQIELLNSAKQRADVKYPEAFALGGLSSAMGIILASIESTYPQTKDTIALLLTECIERNTTK